MSTSSTKFKAAASYSDAELLALYREAEARIVATGQSYSLEGRTLTRANLPDIQERIRELEAKINKASRGAATNYARFKRPE